MFHPARKLVEPHDHTLDSSGGQCLCIWLGGISGNSPEPEFLVGSGVRKDGVDDGATLVTSSTKDDKNLFVRHCGCG